MRNINLYIIIGVNIVVMFLSLWLKPRFQTNDDIAMIYAYSGTSVFSEPTAVTAFSTKIWGLVMVFLYNHLPSGPEAYTLVFYSLIFTCSIIIHTKLFSRLELNKPPAWLLFLPLLGFITLQFYLELQFTMMAGLLCFTGALLFYNGENKFETIGGILLVFTGSIIRPDVIPVMLAFMFSMAIISRIFKMDARYTYGYIVKRFLVLFLIFGAVITTDQLIHTKGEKEFLDFNSFRVEIVDYNSDEANSGILPTHWDKVEVQLFKNWFYSDKILYNRNKAYQFASTNGGDIKGNRKFEPDLLQFRQPLFNCMFLLMLAAIFLTVEWKKSAVSLFFYLLVFLAMIILLSLFFKTPPFRVSFVMFAAMVLMYLSIVLRKAEPAKLSSVRYLASALIVCFAFLGLINHLKHRNTQIRTAACSESYDPGVVYIHWPVYPFENIDPFQVTSAEKQKNNIVWICSFSVHPAIRTSFKNFSYTNLTSDIIGKEHFISFILPSESDKWLDFREAYCDFIAKHYQRKVYFERVENKVHCYGFNEYKLKEYREDALPVNASQL